MAFNIFYTNLTTKSLVLKRLVCWEMPTKEFCRRKMGH